MDRFLVFFFDVRTKACQSLSLCGGLFQIVLDVSAINFAVVNMLQHQVNPVAAQ